MTQSTKTILIVTGIILLTLVALAVGVFFGHRAFGFQRFMPGMRNFDYSPGGCPACLAQPGRWDQRNLRPRNYTNDDALPILTIAQAEEAVEVFISRAGYENLQVGEVMIFSNHAYAEIMESDSGIGAMEVLINPITLRVSPEPGPNMMWNLKYGHMRGGGRMGNWSQPALPQDALAMPISPEEAIQIAQEYLESRGSNLTVANEADVFYGYYTLHTLEDGKVSGMLSVHGFNGQVFVHTWHGDFIEMSEHAEE